VSKWALENISDDQREGHIKAIERFGSWMQDDCPSRLFSIYMCCRYGKSDTIRNLALLAIAESKASCALVVHPGLTLSKQFLDPVRMIGWRQRWLPTGPRLAKVATLKDFAYQSMCNDEWLGSIHIHAIMQPMQMALAKQWVKKCVDDTGLPPIIFFDEAHQFSMDNHWGDVAREFHAIGCLVVVLTATPFRNDNDDVFGFKKRSVSDEVRARQIKYIQPSEDPGKLELHTSVREEKDFIIEADVEVPFAQGWQEKCIAKCSFDLIDWHMEGWGEGREGDKRMLSELPKKEARSNLAQIYRDPSAIDEAVSRALKHLEFFRQGSVKDATVVWYGMNDDTSTGVSSENQKAIRDAIVRHDSSMKVAIATQGEDKVVDEKSDETILKFVDEKKKHYDALILKQMGAAGLDSDRICVVVLWNTIRSLGQMIQMAMRGGNAKSKTHFVIVALADSMTKEKLEAFISGEGGNYVDVVETDHDMVLIDKNDKPKNGYIPVEVADSGMSDSDGNLATYEDIRLALTMIATLPIIIHKYTYPEIAAKARTLGVSALPSIDNYVFQDTSAVVSGMADNLEEYKKKIGKAMFFKQYRRYSNGSKEDLSEYGRLYAEAASAIKKRAGVFESWDKSNKKRSLRTPDYQKWTNAADQILKELRDEIDS